jgi:flagellar biosynthesis/type III secretory pathway protein FliH
MCNLGEGIYEDGLMKGKQEGWEKGRKEGRKKKVNWNSLSNC